MAGLKAQKSGFKRGLSSCVLHKAINIHLGAITW